MLIAYVANSNSSFNLHAHGAIAADSLASSLANLGYVASQPGFRSFWAKWRQNFQTSLRARVDSTLAQTVEPAAAQIGTPVDSAWPTQSVRTRGCRRQGAPAIWRRMLPSALNSSSGLRGRAKVRWAVFKTCAT